MIVQVPHRERLVAQRIGTLSREIERLAHRREELRKVLRDWREHQQQLREERNRLEGLIDA